MKKKLAAKLWFFARCNQRVAMERSIFELHKKITAALTAGESLAKAGTL